MEAIITSWPALGALQDHQVRALSAMLNATVFRGALKRLLWPHKYTLGGDMRLQLTLTGRGFILAHSMGLGKTVTTIAYLSVVQSAHCAAQGLSGAPLGSQRPFVGLVVAPKSAVDNWCSELEAWWLKFNTPATPIRQRFSRATAQWQHLHLVNLLNLRDSAQSLSEVHNAVVHAVEAAGKAGVGGAVVFVASYEVLAALNGACLTFARDGGTVFVDVAVFDEAHRIQREGTSMHVAAQSCGATCKLCLSGYPMQNNAREFYTMMALVSADARSSSAQCVALPDVKDFEERIASVLDAAQEAQLRLRDPTRRADVLRSPQWAAIIAAIGELRLLAKGRCHRATLQEVRDAGATLPRVSAIVVWCNLTDSQRALYDALSSSASVDSAGFFAKAAWMSMVCVHPAALDLQTRSWESDDDSEASPSAPSVNADAILRAANAFGRNGLGDVSHGAKMSVLIDLVTHASSRGEKTVVFSHFRSVLLLFQRLLLAIHPSVKIVTLTGASTTVQRRAAVAAFQTDASTTVLAATTRAAGVALNLTAATRVIVVDCHWNPCHEAQAFHRCVRLGMAHHVTLIRLLCSNTLEARIREAQRGKEEVFHRVFDRADLGVEIADSAEPNQCGPSENIFMECDEDALLANRQGQWRVRGLISGLGQDTPTPSAALSPTDGLVTVEAEEIAALDNSGSDDGSNDDIIDFAPDDPIAPKPARPRRRGRSDSERLLAELRRSRRPPNSTEVLSSSMSDVRILAALRGSKPSDADGTPVGLDDDILALLDAADEAGSASL